MRLKIQTQVALVALLALTLAATAQVPENSGPGVAELIPLEQRPRWTGDLDALMAHRQLRVAVPYSRLNLYFDGPRARGLTVDVLTEFEKFVNSALNTGSLRVPVIIIPLPMEDAVDALLRGQADIIAGTFSMTRLREHQVAFSEPASRPFDEIIVTSPQLGPLSSFDDLVGVPIYVNADTAYFESLSALNVKRQAEGKPALDLVAADPHLETADILEMTNVGIVQATVADAYLAHLWVRVFEDIQLNENLAVAHDRRIAWAVRPDSPQLTELINQFMAEHRQGTLIGNVIINRYLKDDRWVRSITNPQDNERLRQVADLFRRYSDQYGFDWLMVVAQAYQESGIDQSKRNPSGAVGVMQIKPATAQDMGIHSVEELEPNIHAGIKYLRWIVTHFFDDPTLDDVSKTLLAFASYNAGPSRIARLREETAAAGLDPDLWFGNVEVLVSRDIGRETVQYVGNIYKYYIAYRLMQAREANRSAAENH